MVIDTAFLGLILAALAGVILAAAVVGVVLMAALPSIGRWLLRRIAYPVLAGKPGQNMLLQTLVLLRLTDPETIISIMRRAETGKPFARPYGSTRRFKGMDELVFRPAQLARFPRREGEVETRTVIGPKARKPMELAIPLMVTGMAWGLALTREAKLAAAEAANLAGTCTNSGESGFVEEERKAANLYVVQ
ncbi:MAG: glutamate synthase-related protein, partial [Actinobacteria bacterium]|nr:glutamate synthase-related protein [Actinomycetota bacterium]